MLEHLWVFWFLMIPMLVELLFALPFVNRMYRHSDASRKARFLIQVTTKNAPDFVHRTIDKIVDSANNAQISDYAIWIVTENPLFRDDRCRIVVIPPAFSPNCKYKARALEYAHRLKVSEGITGSDTWIYYLDEENLMQGDTFIALCDYVLKEGSSRPVACGTIHYKRTKSLFAFLCDALRPFGSLQNCGWSGLYGWFYLQGENTLVRSDIEAKVGWEYGPTLTEDLYNGVHIRERTKVKFGWHGAVIQSLSPESIGDLLVQRRRWFLGGWQATRDGRVPLIVRLHLSYRLATWLLGFVSIIITIVGFFVVYDIPLWARVVLLPMTAVFPLAYCIGAFVNSRRVGLALVTAPLSPLLALLETGSSWYALIRPTRTFDVIRKS